MIWRTADQQKNDIQQLQRVEKPWKENSAKQKGAASASENNITMNAIFYSIE